MISNLNELSLIMIAIVVIITRYLRKLTILWYLLHTYSHVANTFFTIAVYTTLDIIFLSMYSQKYAFMALILGYFNCLPYVIIWPQKECDCHSFEVDITIVHISQEFLIISLNYQ